MIHTSKPNEVMFSFNGCYRNLCREAPVKRLPLGVAVHIFGLQRQWGAIMYSTPPPTAKPYLGLFVRTNTIKTAFAFTG